MERKPDFPQYGHPDSNSRPAFGMWLQGLLLLVFYLLFYGATLPGLVRDWYNNAILPD